ncbi:hypothetical protein BUL40_05085 [Croceivirga radicis]|uniref:Uncharacterized protein n=1 Tax=Croceivirga radicis TaxID=1929488 RepID=A0A1V6LSR8_9FLAO|nr:hypothetical protein [Croceivirga radicis]OQD43215.1 hypothetical protein BUL40_05085 [Croceivirga radicis]
MRKTFLSLVVATPILLGSCKVDQKKEAELPEVDVDIETAAGQLPSYDVDWADVNVGTTTKTMEIPKVVVVMEEEEVEVPYLDVDMPEDYGEKTERTLRVEAEIADTTHNLDIEKIYANEDNLIVVSSLEKGEQSLGNKTMRISDQVTLNAPDLNVKYYIIGERPEQVFNSSYTYVKDMETLKNKLEGYQVIYES